MSNQLTESFDRMSELKHQGSPGEVLRLALTPALSPSPSLGASARPRRNEVAEGGERGNRSQRLGEAEPGAFRRVRSCEALALALGLLILVTGCQTHDFAEFAQAEAM